VSKWRSRVIILAGKATNSKEAGRGRRRENQNGPEFKRGARRSREGEEATCTNGNRETKGGITSQGGEGSLSPKNRKKHGKL